MLRFTCMESCFKTVKMGDLEVNPLNIAVNEKEEVIPDDPVATSRRNICPSPRYICSNRTHFRSPG